MARTLSVKIPVSSLISDIEKSIAKIDEDVAAYPAEYEKYKSELVQYEKDLVAIAIKALSNPTNIGTEYDSAIRVQTNSYRNNISVEFDGDKLGFPQKPEEPKKPNEKNYFGREYLTRKELLERNLRILKMTSQEEVSASSYSAVIDLI